MWTEHIFVTGATSELKARFRANIPSLSSSHSRFPTDRSKAVILLQFFFISASVVSYLAFVLSLFGPHPPFFWRLRRAVLRDCGISWVSSLIITKTNLSNMFSMVLTSTTIYVFEQK